MLKNAAYQHDLNNAAGQNKKQAFISQHVNSFGESDYDPGEDTPLDQGEDDSSPYSICQSFFNLLSILLNSIFLTNIGESFLRLQRSLSLSTARNG